MNALVVTGSLLSQRERGALAAIRKQVAAMRASSGAWLDLQQKLDAAEGLAAMARFRTTRAYRDAPYRDVVDAFFARDGAADTPELTEVSLCTLLAAEGVDFRVATWTELHADPALRERLLAETRLVLASTTLLRDASELTPLVALLKRPHNRVVVGGALTAILHEDWPGVPGVDVVAVGYGESLVPAIVAWARGGFGDFAAPDGGRVADRDGVVFVHGALPTGVSLDALPTPDWALAERTHGRAFPLVHYESVRGCPYRCAFCNYPYLFDDTKFRYRSAATIAADWRRLADGGARTVSCLDSLFTMPKRRLVELCDRLVADGVPVQWICYARADDLADPDVCAAMRAAGCRQVQIGVESGNQGQLDRMDKRCTVAANARAIRNCRDAGIVSLVTVIVGFPGETPETVADTLAFLRDAPPDVYYAAPFNTRVDKVPVMRPASRARTGLVTTVDGRSSAPYWRHASMSCTEVSRWIGWLHDHLRGERVALDGQLFYRGLLEYEPGREREALLDVQRDAWADAPWLHAAFRTAGRFVQGRLEADVARALPG